MSTPDDAREPWQGEPPEPKPEQRREVRPFFTDPASLMRLFGRPEGPVDMLNGCPRCGRRAALRRRDRARWCLSGCERAFYPLSPESVILPETKAA